MTRRLHFKSIYMKVWW